MAKEVLPSGVVLYDPLDYKSRREAIFDSVKGAFEKSFPRVVNGVRMEVADLQYKQEAPISMGKEKDMLMSGMRLYSKLKGTVRLYDDATNTLLDEKSDYTVANVPYLTDRGTIIDGANDYTIAMQARLLPGVYHHKQANGNLAAQFNTRRGGGPSFKIVMDPTSAKYTIEIQGRTAPLYPVLRAFGVTDDQMEQAWGPEVLLANRKDDPKVIPKLYGKLMGRKAVANASFDEMAADVKRIFESGTVNEDVLKRTLPNAFQPKVASAWAMGIKYGEKVASASAGTDWFKPDYTPAELKDMGVDRSRTGEAEWLNWYLDPNKDVDPVEGMRMRMRWADSVRRQISAYIERPSGEKALNLIRWAVNPFRYTAPEQTNRIASEIAEMTKDGLPDLDDDTDLALEYAVKKGEGGQELKDRIDKKLRVENLFLYDEGHINDTDEELDTYVEQKLACCNLKSDPDKIGIILAYAESK